MFKRLDESQFFSLLRVALGLWLCFHFIFLLPYSKELYSLAGIKVAGGELYLKSLLFPLRTEIGINLLIILSILLSLAFTFKFYRRIASALLFIIWIFLFHQNLLTYIPILPYIGWLLLAISFIPENEPRFFWLKNNQTFTYSKILFHGFWLITAFGYTSSGFQKFFYTPLWNQGTALEFIFNYPAARFGFIYNIYQALPLILKQSINYSVVLIEGLYAFSFFNKELRKIFWLGILFMHIAILVTIRFSELSIGMIIVHSFLIESDWFKFGGLSTIEWNNFFRLKLKD